MLAIRMQRTGRKGHAQFRVIVQDSHRSPSTGKVIEYLGSYNPHTKEAVLEKEAIEKYMSNGAQPSNRVAILLKKEGVKLPKWVTIDTSGKRTLKNSDKLRKNRPDEPKEKAPVDEPIEEVEKELVEEIAEEVVEDIVEEEAQKIVEEKKVEDEKAEDKKAAKEEKPDEK